MAETVFLGIGSNLGDRKSFLDFAVRNLEDILSEIRVSRVYETDPMYVREQEPFLNAVVRGETTAGPAELLDMIQDIEKKAGRNREGAVRRGPRVLDIDILLYGDRRIETPRLVCPHPLIRERLFVLVPLLEIAPDCTEPGTGIHYRDYMSALDGSEYGIRPLES